MEKEIVDVLKDIQSLLVAPKGQYNSFGKYKYRSCEDVLEALKPLLTSSKCALTITDEIVLVGDRYYVKATATIYNSNNYISVNAYAREPKERKGMDESQITGASSSYARKYALNGLFAIDDNKDPDTTNDHGKEMTTPKVATMPEKTLSLASSQTIEQKTSITTPKDPKDVKFNPSDEEAITQEQGLALLKLISNNGYTKQDLVEAIFFEFEMDKLSKICNKHLPRIKEMFSKKKEVAK